MPLHTEPRLRTLVLYSGPATPQQIEKFPEISEGDRTFNVVVENPATGLLGRLLAKITREGVVPVLQFPWVDNADDYEIDPVIVEDLTGVRVYDDMLNDGASLAPIIAGQMIGNIPAAIPEQVEYAMEFWYFDTWKFDRVGSLYTWSNGARANYPEQV